MAAPWDGMKNKGGWHCAPHFHHVTKLFYIYLKAILIAYLLTFCETIYESIIIKDIIVILEWKTNRVICDTIMCHITMKSQWRQYLKYYAKGNVIVLLFFLVNHHLVNWWKNIQFKSSLFQEMIVTCLKNSFLEYWYIDAFGIYVGIPILL